jgi:hypothetical protein
MYDINSLTDLVPILSILGINFFHVNDLNGGLEGRVVLLGGHAHEFGDCVGG